MHKEVEGVYSGIKALGFLGFLRLKIRVTYVLCVFIQILCMTLAFSDILALLFSF